MPSDIRSFFGGKTSTPIRQKEITKEDDSKKKRRSNMDHSSYVVGIPCMLIYIKGRKIINDSDDDEPARS